MSDMERIVEEAIKENQIRNYECPCDTCVSLLEPSAHAAIVAATPHIRAALFDELIAASNRVLAEEGHYYWGYVDVTGWLEMKKEQENTQP